MYLGKIVEIASRDEIFKNPQHPYTQALIAAIPRVGTGKKRMRKSLGGEVPSPINPPAGCAFHPRCPQAMPKCSQAMPTLKNYTNSESNLNLSHQTACWLFEKENQ
jgi:oligopeptide transport system ATP-binding protein